jgi:hypothetical protein
MPSIEEIQQYLTGAWRMMTGKPDGLKLLDISADGFWNSFFAIVVALPALIVGWASVANEIAAEPAVTASRFSLLLRLAFVDLSTWVLPLAALALAARPAGIADRFVHYVVSSNWGSALIVWIMLPPALLRLVVPGAAELATIVSLGLFGVTLVLGWRLTNAAIGRGPGVATGVFAGMFVASLIVLFVLQTLFGLGPSEQPAMG